MLLTALCCSRKALESSVRWRTCSVLDTQVEDNCVRRRSSSSTSWVMPWTVQDIHSVQLKYYSFFCFIFHLFSSSLNTLLPTYSLVATVYTCTTCMVHGLNKFIFTTKYFNINLCKCSLLLTLHWSFISVILRNTRICMVAGLCLTPINLPWISMHST